MTGTNFKAERTDFPNEKNKLKLVDMKSFIDALQTACGSWEPQRF